MSYDVLIVGAGLTGATLARELTARGKRCLVIDRREHVAGNCHTPEYDGQLVHAFGPHYFHTNSDAVWHWVQRFAEWRAYTPRVRARVGPSVFSLPINLGTLQQLWGVTTPEGAAMALAERREAVAGDDAESYLLRTIGRELYEMFFRDYTKKQWGRHPSELPSTIVARLPVRTTFDDNYHRAKYQAVPRHGYTAFVESVLAGIEVQLGAEFEPRTIGRYERVIYTGAVDALFNHDEGKLGYRSLRFEHEELSSTDDYQGCAQMNYPGELIPFTRIIEHKHIHPSSMPGTIITREYPVESGDPYYPVMTSENVELADRYRQRAHARGITTAGRLGTFRYMDMDGAIGSALRLAEGLV